jgi:hypothetical protein
LKFCSLNVIRIKEMELCDSKILGTLGILSLFSYLGLFGYLFYL